MMWLAVAYVAFLGAFLMVWSVSVYPKGPGE